jgi:hypothetical protein
MRTGRFKKLLEVVLGRPSLPLEITFGNRYKSPVGVINFFSVIAIADHCSKVA